MNKIKNIFVFVVNMDGEERIVTWPNGNGIDVPLVYLSEEEIENDNMRKAIQNMANVRKLYFELREFTLVEKSVETFYPTLKEYNA